MERARKEEDKRLRRRAILDAARRELRTTRFQVLQMAEVADKAGLAKGTLYLYFQTKEALALALLEELLGAWFDDLDAGLDSGRRQSPRRIAQLMLDALERHEPLARLLALLQSVLEHNIPIEEARRFKGRLLARLVATGERLERHLKHLGAGGGARLILHANALVVGLLGMAEPAPVVAEVLAEPALQPLRVDFRSEFLDALEALASHLKKGRTP